MADKSPILLDKSDSIIVIYCTEHPWWRACRFLQDDAYAAACGHEEREHPGDWRHRNAAQMRTRRTHQKSANPEKCVMSAMG